MELNWVFFAVVLFVAVGTYFFTVIPGLVKPGQSPDVNPSMAPQASSPK